MKILNVIVFYNNKEEVKQYIEDSILIANGLLDIAVVVNSDKNNQIDTLLTELDDKTKECIKVYNFNENVGYLNALLKVIQKININDYLYIILSNTDILYSSSNFFTELSQKNYDKHIGCIAPSVFATKSQSYSNPHYINRIPKKSFKKLYLIFKYPHLGMYYLKLAELKAYKKRKIKKQSCMIYSPHGCYMIFTQQFIQKIEGYEYGVKMYSEESCIGELLKRYGYSCKYDSELEIVHQESSVTGKINYKKRFELWRESIKYILDTFY